MEIEFLSISNKVEQRKKIYQANEPKLFGYSIFFGTSDKQKALYLLGALAVFGFIFYKRLVYYSGDVIVFSDYEVVFREWFKDKVEKEEEEIRVEGK